MCVEKKMIYKKFYLSFVIFFVLDKYGRLNSIWELNQKF